jgi:hypothetical protein
MLILDWLAGAASLELESLHLSNLFWLKKTLEETFAHILRAGLVPRLTEFSLQERPGFNDARPLLITALAQPRVRVRRLGLTPAVPRDQVQRLRASGGFVHLQEVYENPSVIVKPPPNL